jgi:hypothetical protein
MDRAGPHNSRRTQRCVRASRAQRLPHPAHSSDLAPGDFVLLGCIQGKLSNSKCESREDLSNAMTEIFIGIDQEVMRSVFESWVNWIKCVIKYEGWCHSKSRQNKRHFFKIGRDNGRIRISGFSCISRMEVDRTSPIITKPTRRRLRSSSSQSTFS